MYDETLFANRLYLSLANVDEVPFFPLTLCIISLKMRNSGKKKEAIFYGYHKASKLIYDYIRRDEDDHVEEVKRH